MLQWSKPGDYFAKTLHFDIVAVRITQYGREATRMYLLNLGEIQFQRLYKGFAENRVGNLAIFLRT